MSNRCTCHQWGGFCSRCTLSDESWVCGHCGGRTKVRHFLQRDGVMVHDPDAAYREAVGLDAAEPDARLGKSRGPEAQEQQ